MDKVVAVYKKISETPLQCLDRLRDDMPNFKDSTLSYAGRLDPMAEGVMLVLVDDGNKNREKYLGLNKTYLTEILFGIETDTGDVLGIVDKIEDRKIEKSKIEEELEDNLKDFVGKITQQYPKYSSKNFAGSYENIRDDKIVNQKNPSTHNVEIFSIDLVDVREVSGQDLFSKIKNNVSNVVGDFRQQVIIKVFSEELSQKKDLSFSVATIRLSVSSGFYVRQFAVDLGKKIGIPAITFSILREKVDKWSISDCIL